jgi:hypothetical protein
MKIDMRHRIAIWIGLSLIVVAGFARAAEGVPLLAQTPTLSTTDAEINEVRGVWNQARCKTVVCGTDSCTCASVGNVCCA